MASRWDADVPFGWDEHDAPVSIPLPGIDGRHVLIGGSTGAGKTHGVNGILMEASHRPEVALVLLDPKRVGLGPWGPRATTLAKGRNVSNDTLRRVLRTMYRRYGWVDREGLEVLPIGQPSPDGTPWSYLLVVVDELADFSRSDGTTEGKRAASRRIEMLTEGIQMARAAGIGFLLCTQRPSQGVVPLDIRDNCRVRIAFGTESYQQSAMILGDTPKWVKPHADIAESDQGVAWLKRDRTFIKLRTYMAPTADVRAVAHRTSTLRVDLGWPHVLEDPLPWDDDEDQEA